MPFAGVVLTDEGGRIIGVNNKFLEITGLDQTFFAGRLFSDLIQAEGLSEKGCVRLKVGDRMFGCIVNTMDITDDKGVMIGSVIFVEPLSSEPSGRNYIDDEGKLRWIAISDKDKKEEFLCNIFHGIQDAILIMNPNGDILSFNMKTLEILDVDMDFMANAGSLKKITADGLNLKVADKFINDAFAGKSQLFTWQLQKPATGMVIDVEIFLTPINKMGEDVLLATIRDITDKKKIQDELVNSENRYRQLVEHSPDGIVIHRGGKVKYVNPAGAVILGGKEDADILGRRVLEFFPKESHEDIKQRIRDLYENKESIPLRESRMVRLDGSFIDVEFTAMPFDMNGQTAVQVVLRDITEKKKQDQYIRYLALHDSLTGLPNRELLADTIAKSIERRKRDKLKNALVYLDLDGFKPINDTLGHDAGDEALREIARRLENSIRGSDTAARIGGDEFVLLLEGVHGKDEISVIASRISESINMPLDIMEHSFHVGASMGISVYPDDAQDSASLTSRADKAMYHVKQTGKNRYAFYHDLPEK